MRKTILTVLAALMILTMLTGCQLAVENDEAEGEDVLCGVFITLDYVEAAQPEEEIELPPNWNGDPNDIIFPETRFYATSHEDEHGFVDYTFDGVEGISCFMVQQGEDEGRYTATKFGPQIQDGHTMITNDNASLAGTLLFDVNKNCMIYANPVYQTPDGEVYMIPGNCMGFGEMSEGGGGSTKLSATRTETIDGEKVSRTFDVEIKIEAVFSNKKVVIKQMDSEDQLIADEVITKEDIPKTLRLLHNTVYVIVEEHYTDKEGGNAVKRELADIDAESLGVRFAGENGIVHTYPIELEK